MATSARDMDKGAPPGVATLLARAGRADLRADARLRGAIDDYFLTEDARLDDRTRLALAVTLDDLVGGVALGLVRHAARLLAARDAGALAETLSADDRPVLDRLVGAGLLRDGDVMRELIGRVRQDVLADALPPAAPDDPDRASLLPRLAQSVDGVVATGAVTLLAAESRRRVPNQPQFQPRSTDLPAELHHRLVWWVAATLRERFAEPAGAALPALDRALAEAALRAIAAHDEGERLEAAAMRLAAALDPQADELPTLLTEALADRRLALFVALLGHALGLDYGDAREIVLDPAADRLWLLLRALELDRPAIARIGLALSEADPRRDLDRFADALDGIVAVSPAQAREALAPLTLHPDYRAALTALARAKAALP